MYDTIRKVRVCPDKITMLHIYISFLVAASSILFEVLFLKSDMQRCQIRQEIDHFFSFLKKRTEKRVIVKILYLPKGIDLTLLIVMDTFGTAVLNAKKKSNHNMRQLYI